MNRRTFLKAMAGTLLLAELPDDHYVMAEQPPDRMDGDDTAYLQWHIDNAVEVPVGDYTISDTLLVGVTPQSKLIMFNSTIRGEKMNNMPMLYWENGCFVDMAGCSIRYGY